MPKYKDIREGKGLQAKQVAEKAGIDAAMYSRFENYRVLPIPEDFQRVLEALECSPTDIYEPSEVRLLPGAASVKAVGGAITEHREPAEYKLTVRVSNATRELLTREKLQKCGYKSITDWLNACVRRFEKQYEAILKHEKTPRSRRATGEVVEGRPTTIKPQTVKTISKKSKNVKEALS